MKKVRVTISGGPKSGKTAAAHVIKETFETLGALVAVGPEEEAREIARRERNGIHQGLTGLGVIIETVQLGRIEATALENEPDWKNMHPLILGLSYLLWKAGISTCWTCLFCSEERLAPEFPTVAIDCKESEIDYVSGLAMDALQAFGIKEFFVSHRIQLDDGEVVNCAVVVQVFQRDDIARLDEAFKASRPGVTGRAPKTPIAPAFEDDLPLVSASAYEDRS